MNLNGDNYQVEGVNLLDVAEEFGTPLYVYSAAKIEEQYDKLMTAFGSLNVKLKYAGKACSNINVLRLLCKKGAGYDAVSINEVKLAIRAGFAASDIMFTPNMVAFDEIEEAVTLGVQINIDNIPFLHEFGKKYGYSVPLCVRINPHIVAGGNRNIQVGHVGSKFGISILQFDQVLEAYEEHNLNIAGLHVHTGSDILDTDVFLKGAEIVFKQARNFPSLKFLDFGSGFKVAYKDGDHVTDISELGEKLTKAVNKFCSDYGRKLEVWFEPGKFLVSESGYFITNVNLVKESVACTFLGVDSGFNHLIRPMLYGSYHNIVNVSNPHGKEKVYNVVGNICETDTFAEDRDIAEAKVGDKLVFKNAGAYGFEMGSNFNSRFKPAQVMIHKGEAKLIRQRDKFEDLLNNQIEIEL